MPDNPVPPLGEIILYQTEDGGTRVECRFADQTLWLSQALMAELFQVTPQNITLHLQALYEDGEIAETATCKEFSQVRAEGTRQVTRTVKFYSLDAILAVGYRVRSERGTQFRRWATERLQEYLVKGFTNRFISSLVKSDCTRRRACKYSEQIIPNERTPRGRNKMLLEQADIFLE